MEEKTYTITVRKKWVGFSYQVNDYINREIRFKKAKHWMHFASLLHEAGYRLDRLVGAATQPNSGIEIFLDNLK